MTPVQQDLVDRAKSHLHSDERIHALWLAGSLGRGKGDEWSDVDLLACCEEGSRAEVSADLVKSIIEIAPPLLINPLFGGVVINVVAEGWRRFDITLIEPDGLARHDPARLTELFNRAGVEPSGTTPDSYRPTPGSVLPIISEFLRVLGLAPVALGRGEYALAMQGVQLLRGLTIDLMLEQNGVSQLDRGGALKRFPLLTGEQRQELLGPPPLTPERASVIANHACLARNFLPRAKRLAEDVGAEWPAAFEQGTLAHLRKFGISIG